jgi:hypothetical protein
MSAAGAADLAAGIWHLVVFQQKARGTIGAGNDHFML